MPRSLVGGLFVQEHRDLIVSQEPKQQRQRGLVVIDRATFGLSELAQSSGELRMLPLDTVTRRGDIRVRERSAIAEIPPAVPFHRAVTRGSLEEGAECCIRDTEAGASEGDVSHGGYIEVVAV